MSNSLVSAGDLRQCLVGVSGASKTSIIEQKYQPLLSLETGWRHVA